jgi:hypothetical protein
MDIAPPQEKAHQDGFNTTTKHFMTTLKEAIHIVRAITQKANPINCCEVSISFLYLIN